MPAVGAELFHTDGRTDGQTDRHDETTSHFSQFYEGTSKYFRQKLYRKSKHTIVQ